MTVTSRFSAFAFFATIASSPAFALPLATSQEAAVAKIAPSAAEIEESAVDFTAIVALNNCSGSLVRFVDSKPEDTAMVLTNGHCYEGGFLDPGKFVSNKASSRSFTLLKGAGSSLATLKADRVIYATMTGTDIALYRLNTTYAAIESKYSVKALTISHERSVVTAPIRIVSGYWKKIYSCSISDFVYNLREGEWTFNDSIRYQQPGCETIGGTSGSPIIHAETYEIVGINNTGNEDGGKCTLNNPCEVDEQGNITVTKGASYGQQLYQIYSCLNDQGQFDLTVAGCKLPGAEAN